LQVFCGYSILPSSMGNEIPGLSKREYEVCDLLAQGFKSREVAERLGLGFHTVRSYAKTAYKKLGIHKNVELSKLSGVRQLAEAENCAKRMEEQRTATLFGDVKAG
jgi:DNA-binding CsgD family transcriptional regulator